jgi:hypothetical protein
VFPGPVCRRVAVEPGQQGVAHFVPQTLEVRSGRKLGGRPVSACDEDRIQFGMQPPPEAEEREHGIVHRGQVAPQVDQPILARRHFGEQLLFAEAGKQFVRAFQLMLPRVDSGLHDRLLGAHGLLLMDGRDDSRGPLHCTAHLQAPARFGY